MKRIDIYGEQITFKIDGKDRTTSRLGVLLSIVTLLLASIYMMRKGQDLLEHGETKYQVFKKLGQLDSSREFTFDEMDINFAVMVQAREAVNQT